MYVVKIDGRTLYYPNDEECALSEAVLARNIADAGSFSFMVPQTNPEYNNLKNRSSIIQIMEDEKEIFCGEIRSLEEDYFKNKKCYAVGELAYLYDTIQPQSVFHDHTPRELLTIFIDRHNELTGEKKKFIVGHVNAIDKNNSIYRYSNRESTYQAITEKLTRKLGGYLKVRKENGVRYLDWLTAESYGKVCNQPIRFDENLLDYSSTISGEDIATACIPLGARLDETKIEGLDAYTDITAVNGGKEYISLPEAVKNFGWAQVVVNFDDVTEPPNLLQKGKKWLEDNQYEKLVLNLTAIDLRKLGFNYDEIEVGDYVNVVAKPYGMERLIQVTQMSTDLLDASKNVFQLGHEENVSMTSIQAKKYQIQAEEMQKKSEYIMSKIDNATAMITGSAGGYKLSEYDEDGKWIRDLYMDMPDKEQAKHLMQINMNGFGFSTTGYAGPYENAWTIDGNLVADFITAGTMLMDRMRGGTLALGGFGNIDGIMKMMDASGAIFGMWDNAGLELVSGDSVVKVSPKDFTPRVSGGMSISGNTNWSGGGVTKGKTFIAYDAMWIYRDTDVTETFYTWLHDGGLSVQGESRNDSGYYGVDCLAVNGSFDGDLDVYGQKNRVVNTKDFGPIKLSAYEMPTPMFGDIGTGTVGTDGLCYIPLDNVLLQTVNTEDCEYQVFLQNYGEGVAWIKERTPFYFVISGSPGLIFGWEVKAKQIGYEIMRLEEKRNKVDKGDENRYAQDAQTYIEKYMEGLLK